MKDNSIVDPKNIGIKSTGIIFSSNNYKTALSRAMQIIYKSFSLWVKGLHLYIIDGKHENLREEVVIIEGEYYGGSDIIPINQIPQKLSLKSRFIKRMNDQREDVFIPLKIKNQLIGLLELNFKNIPDFLNKDDLNLMGKSLALGLQYILLYKKARNSSRLLHETARLSRELHSLIGTEKLINRFVTMAVKKLGFDRATIFIFGENTQTVVRCVTAHCGKKPFIVENIQCPSDFKSEPFQLDIIPGFWLPIKIGPRILGGLLVDNLFSLEPVPNDMIETLFELTGQVALAIENTALFRNLKEKAVRDDLTGLFRSGFFYEEVKKGIENNSSSALISLDIDFFKSINDTFGHPAGDEVLKVTAQTLKKLLRAGDIACRMGGDEFMIFLPEVDSRHAYNISQRIIHYFLSHKIKIQGNKNFMISLSAGVALYPSDADNFQELLNQSDAALYLSKQKGRGRVHMAQDLLD